MRSFALDGGSSPSPSPPHPPPPPAARATTATTTTTTTTSYFHLPGQGSIILEDESMMGAVGPGTTTDGGDDDDDDVHHDDDHHDDDGGRRRRRPRRRGGWRRGRRRRSTPRSRGLEEKGCFLFRRAGEAAPAARAREGESCPQQRPCSGHRGSVRAAHSVALASSNYFGPGLDGPPPRGRFALASSSFPSLGNFSQVLSALLGVLAKAPRWAKPLL